MVPITSDAMKPTILVTGSNGQLGSEIKALARHFTGYNFLFTDLEELDVTDNEAIEHFLNHHRADIIINCAAYTAVDRAENEPEPAAHLNTLAPGWLARQAAKRNALLVHFSTDYVFDGSQTHPYKETDTTNPLSVYGKTKLAGEQAIFQSGARALILRTSWLYSGHGNNFVKTIARLAAERTQLQVIDDQIGTPTYAADLARCVLYLISRFDYQGPAIYHYSNEGVCTWYQFASLIVEILGLPCEVVPVSTKQYRAPAPRPCYSVLDKQLIRSAYGLSIPLWDVSLRMFLPQIINQSTPYTS